MAREPELEINISEDVYDKIGKILADDIIENNDSSIISSVLYGNNPVDYMSYAINDILRNGDFYAVVDATEYYLQDKIRE